MSILKVARMGHPVLREVADEVDPTTVRSPAFQKLIDDMIETMHEYHGVGLAAPQVHEGLRLFVALLDDDPDAKSEAAVIINPEIVPNGSEIEEGWEGCLSVPGMRGLVPRYVRLRYRGFDEQGAAIDRTVEGFHARVVQHECDHLDGILYPQRIEDMTAFGFQDELVASGVLPLAAAAAD